jgi:uncharacterized membrane protein (DUF4010 family)
MNFPLGRSRTLRGFVVCAALATCDCSSPEDPVNISVAIDTTVSHQTLVGFGAATAYQAYLLGAGLEQFNTAHRIGDHHQSIREFNLHPQRHLLCA